MKEIRNEKGATAVVVAICMSMLVGFAALAIDIGHLYVVQNELQNAADAGALAGARDLYMDTGLAVNANANQTAYNIATQNKSEKVSVDIDWTSGTNEGDIQRGHWSFAKREFEPIDSLAAIAIGNYTTQELDNNQTEGGAKLDFVNAVRVFAKRDSAISGGTDITSFFARIFGFENFKGTAEAIAYIGFAGTLVPEEVDIPIAICKQSITKIIGTTEKYDCSTGRMLNSGTNGATHNTAAWTNFTQPCDTANPNSIRPLLDCVGGNPDMITLGDQIGSTGGTEPNLIYQKGKNNLVDCWKAALYDSNGDGIKDKSIDRDGDGIPDMPWNVTLPVIDCPKNNPGNCSTVLGTVNMDIVWILHKGNKINDDAPKKMGDWSNDSTDGTTRWNSFVSYFNLKTVDGEPAIFDDKSIYFLPDCNVHELKGVTGGENFGVLAKVPVLVK